MAMFSHLSCMLHILKQTCVPKKMVKEGFWGGFVGVLLVMIFC